MVERIDKPMQFKDGQPVRTSSPEMCTRSSDTSIDEQTAATLPHFSQILKEDRYAIYVLLHLLLQSCGQTSPVLLWTQFATPAVLWVLQVALKLCLLAYPQMT